MKIIRFWTLALLVGLSLVRTTVAKDKGDKPINPDLLVGKWEASSNEQRGLTVEFTKKGAIKGHFQRGKRRFLVTGKYKVVKKQVNTNKGPRNITVIEATLTDRDNRDKTTTEQIGIQSLSRDQLVLGGLQRPGKPETYRRVE
jgi:uncharacterized protein (TIGR03066 family)